jgi:tRNA(Arg) A34 adenosine deaminase TadA
MCLSAMHMTGIREVRFAYSNDDAEAFGLSTAPVYAEMAKPISRQSIRIEQEKPEFSLYAYWKGLP